ncbi:MAG: 50S ribosomal protein L18 [Nitrososphaerota archaeon]|nr:50S ribosomal protein L18 [Nitrososphaerota archaeon]
MARRPPRRALRGYTDYRKRLKLVKSGKPRLVVRRTNRYLIVQVVESRSGGDHTAVTVTTKILSKFGWRGGGKSIPAAYLAGFLAGRLALQKGYSEAILDIGMHFPHPGSRIFAAVKGVLDAGLSTPVGEGVLPQEERIRGVHITDYHHAASSSGVTPQFRALDPDFLRTLPQKLDEVKQRIIQET